MSYKYTVYYQKEPEGGYTASVPMLPGCITYGSNLPKTKKNIQEAIELYLESLLDHNEPIPSEENIVMEHMQIQISNA